MATYKCLSSCDNLKIVNECDCLLEYDIRWARRLSTSAQVLALGEGIAIVLPDCGTVLVAVMQDVHIGATALDGIDIVVHAANVAEVGVLLDGPLLASAVRSGVEDDIVGLGSTLGHAVNDLLLDRLLGSVALCSIDGSGELGLLALGCSRAPTVGLAIEHTLNLACELPCLLVGGVGSTELSEFLLVVFLDLAFALFLRLGSCLDGSFQLLVSLFSSALCRGTGSNSSLVGGLRGGVRRGGVERLALALGQGAESPGAELDRRTGSLGDLGDGVLVVLVGALLAIGESVHGLLAAARALLAIGESVHGLLAAVDVSFDVFAGLGDELATVFVALACRSHLVDLLLSLGEVIVQSKEGLLRDNVVLRHGRRRGVDDRERKDEDCATHYFLERCLRCEPH